MFNKELLNYLVCPTTRQPLIYDEANNRLISKEIGVAYLIKDGIPNLISSEAIKISDKELSK
ncbi:Trm112 family protein [Caedibacter taeniospiralis]|uniref:Trm112 family protein n=1 Tax=Caedibacter taeniospiralis TaxID=28907 RepID=UPI000C27427A|nr:Trm112 family protein [Caedibacter taeniospiralis]